jgi:hypothetical protein
MAKNKKYNNPFFEKKELMVREQRTVEAMRNGLMGVQGKLAKIAKTYGTPIIRHNTSSWQQKFLDDPYDIVDPNEIPVMDEDSISFDVGFYYDNMRNGHHLEIVWKQEFQEIRCSYEGKLVYLEMGGTLDGYAPGEWEQQVADLYDQAKKQERVIVKSQKEENSKIFQHERQVFLTDMKSKWGM